jgi:hypothetical protein
MQTAARKFVDSRSYRLAMRRKSLSLQNMRSMALRSRQRCGEKQFFHFRFAFGGMLAKAPRSLT